MKKTILISLLIILSIIFIACTKQTSEEDQSSEAIGNDVTSEQIEENQKSQDSDNKELEKSKNESTAEDLEDEAVVNEEKNSKEDLYATKPIEIKGEITNMATLNELIEKDMALYNHNPLTQEHIVSIKLKNITDEYKAKAYYISVDDDNFKFTPNMVDENFLTLVFSPENFTEEKLKSSKVILEK